MYREYVEQLIQYLNKTEFHINGSMTTVYEDGLRQLVECFSNVKEEKKHIFFIGNGGSAAIASHMTADFMKNGGMKTYSLYDSALMTCMGNDHGYEYVFSEPLKFLGGKNDLLVAISSSGNSRNIVNALEIAVEAGMKTISLTGFRADNKAKNTGKMNVYVPVSHFGIVESIHNIILQEIVDMI